MRFGDARTIVIDVDHDDPVLFTDGKMRRCPVSQCIIDEIEQNPTERHPIPKTLEPRLRGRDYEPDSMARHLSIFNFPAHHI
jgi:hypothetical protein